MLLPQLILSSLQSLARKENETYPNCVRGTANDAMSYDYETVVCTDASSSKTPEVAAANVSDMKYMGIKCNLWTR